MDSRLDALQKRLGYRFVRTGTLLIRALTHRSFGADHNERLEFLGDAVLNLAVSSLLFERFGGSDEGDLTRVRAHLVREESLHRTALTLGLPEMLRLSEGEARGGGAQRPSILADARRGIDRRRLSRRRVRPRVRTRAPPVRRRSSPPARRHSWTKDAKTELQEWLQARKIAVPTYRIVATTGQAHAQTFEVECAIPSLSMAESGRGRSRRSAEQEAARRLLDALNASDRPGGPLRL